MAELKLPCGRVALLDDADLRAISGYRWYADVRSGTVYVRGRKPGARTSGRYLHSLLTGARQTDHKNGNGLDNRRLNLRPCEHWQNCLNARKKRPHKRFKGVYFASDRKKWWAQICIKGRRFFGGYHESELAAARAYDALAIRHHGEFARLNFHHGPASINRISWRSAS